MAEQKKVKLRVTNKNGHCVEGVVLAPGDTFEDTEEHSKWLIKNKIAEIVAEAKPA